MSIQGASLWEQFWSYYPSRNGRPKVGKQPCLLLFRLLSESEQADCVQAAKHYAKASKPRADGGFVPEPRDPIRFLRQDWWREWVEVPAQQCQFRSLQSCDQMAMEGSDVCEFHAAYRLKLQKVRGG